MGLKEDMAGPPSLILQALRELSVHGSEEWSAGSVTADFPQGVKSGLVRKGRITTNFMKRYLRVWLQLAPISFSEQIATRFSSVLFLLSKTLRFGFFLLFIFSLTRPESVVYPAITSIR